MSNYGKYGLVALNAVNKLNSMKEIAPSNAWDEAAAFVFPTQLSSRKKGCPRSSFLGLCEEGKVKGVKSGNYTSSKANKAYANDAAELLKNSPKLTTKELWGKVISNAEPKAHNSQMNVVAALFHEGHLIA
ncbi:hypothetical protein H4J56_08745 [Colwellia sp. BRX8-4]|uniref:DUF6979 family protein n=1 Tax=Colwellia sp. BRX8-4 TaxID=2759836 RepID=UPI0015F3617C|nr:hypothetical protein [Colwellia sp. BRX8-4]MBA6365772.1 hypothetical protein [Colwellia sp. BRX8-8]MBA6371513.1 hypothetical protein [Colwellia sp. BRX8-4]